MSKSLYFCNDILNKLADDIKTTRRQTQNKDIMTTEEKIDYWINLSDNDLKVAHTLLKGKHYLYVGFMCHQVIEKIFKAYYTILKADSPPYTHDLRYIAIVADFLERFIRYSAVASYRPFATTNGSSLS